MYALVKGNDGRLASLISIVKANYIIEADRFVFMPVKWYINQCRLVSACNKDEKPSSNSLVKLTKPSEFLTSFNTRVVFLNGLYLLDFFAVFVVSAVGMT